MPGNLVADLGSQPPVNPSPGQLWFNQTTQSLQVLTSDGRWVGALAAGGGAGISVIEDRLLAGDANPVNFLNIPQTYKHLRIVWQGASDSANINTLLMQLNGDNAGNYDWEQYAWIANTASGNQNLTQTAARVGFLAGTSSANASGSGTIDIPNYAGTAWHKNTVALCAYRNLASFADAAVAMLAGLWRNTAAVTSISLLVSPGTIKAGSRFTLYGLS